MVVRVVRSVPDVRVSVFSNDDFRTSFMVNNMLKTEAPFTRYNLLSYRLYNRFDNRLYRVNGV